MSGAKNVTAWIDHTFYPFSRDGWDNDLFRTLVASSLKKEFKILDLGAGAGIIPQMNFRNQVKYVAGIDPDRRVMSNPYLDFAQVGSAESIPFPNGFFDLVLSSNVFEHLSDPGAAMEEVRRVLRPGGLFLIKTPNCLHYVPLIARLTPHSFHQMVNRLRGRSSSNTFRTLYRGNSVRTLGRLASESGLSVVQIQTVEGRPEYLRIFWPTYLIGVLYERLVNRIKHFGAFRVLLLAVFKR